jgi:hypothetical protein
MKNEIKNEHLTEVCSIKDTALRAFEIPIPHIIAQRGIKTSVGDTMLDFYPYPFILGRRSYNVRKMCAPSIYDNHATIKNPVVTNSP